MVAAFGCDHLPNIHVSFIHQMLSWK